MIQRIQSLFLLLTIVLSLLFLSGDNLGFMDKSGAVTKVTFTGFFRVDGGAGTELVERTWPLTTVIVLIPVISLITLLLFRNRKIQSGFAVAGIVLCAGLILLSVYYIVEIGKTYGTRIIPGLKLILPVLLLAFNILAYRGIKKDEDLIRSYDRLR
jgi:hypothetical protein